MTLPIPDRTVLLSFDDGNRSDLTIAAPILRERGFGATFFVTEGFGHGPQPGGGAFLTWEEIAALDEQGFEIGNHSRNHVDMTGLASDEELDVELADMQDALEGHGIPAAGSFCFPGFHHSLRVVEAVRRNGFRYARRGVSPECPDPGTGARGPAYDPREDHPLLIPTTGYAGPSWGLDDLAWAVDQARDGRIASIVFHGTPGPQHAHVSAAAEQFESYMEYLDETACLVIAFRDLDAYVDRDGFAAAPYDAIERRGASGDGMTGDGR